MTARGEYVVVELAGMIGERDVARFPSQWLARRHVEQRYTEEERDWTSARCLYPDVCVEDAGGRSYDI